MEFGVLGPLQVRSDGRPIPVGAPMQRTLLAALLLHANQVVTAEQLIDYLWDQTPPPSARTTLQNYILRLRRLLPARPERAADPLLVTRAPGYLLQLRPGELDLDRFQGLVAGARASTTQGQIERAASLLRDALALWRGPPLCDVASETLCRLNLPQLEDQRLGALEARIDAELGLGLHAELTGELHGLVDEQPLRERFRAQLMLALYRCGRQAEALEVYRSTWRLLDEELGIQPGPELRRLEQAILCEDPSLDLPAIAAAGRPPAAAVSPPHQLPPAIADFTGRRQHLDELDRLLGSETDTTAVVISAIAGTAGVGKTALAIHWAHRVRDRFGDGQLYVSLRGYAPTPPMRSIDALAGFLHALGVPAEQVPVDPDEAAGLYRTLLGDKRLLVVLDNARSADQVRPLLPGSPGCLVLVTSRDRLGGLVARDGARRLTLDVLPPKEAVGLLTRLLGAERVAAEQQAAEELAEVCGLLPLALRIAAANLADRPDQSIAGYLARLRQGDRLAELTVDGDPQAAVRTAFDCSYAALEPDAQRLFRLLGLVPGPELTGPAAAALAGMPLEQAERLLQRLAAVHLLDQPTPGRFAFHDLLRLYAAERCREEDGEAVCQEATAGLDDWYLHAAGAAARLLYPQVLRLPPTGAAGSTPAGFDGPEGALAWLDAERANLVAAVQQAAEHGPRPAAWRLADALGGYFWRRRHTVDWLTVARSAVDAAVRAGHPLAQAAAERNLASAHQCLGHYAQAAEHHTRAITLARKAGWVEGEAAALGSLGQVYVDLGQLRQAARRYAQALALFRQAGSRPGQTGILANLGDVTREMGQLQKAAGYLTQALALYREGGGEAGQDTTLSTLGEVYRDLGRLDDAREHVAQALSLARTIGNRHGEAYDLHVLATLQRDAGRLTAALELAQDALALSRQTREPRLEADVLNTLGGLHLDRDCPRLAVDHHRQALRLARQSSARSPEIAARLGLATAHRHRGRHTHAVADARQALTLASGVGYRILEGQAHTILAAAHVDLGDHARAIEHARRALALHRQTGHRLGYARALVALGQGLWHTSRTDAALPCWQEALALFSEIGAPDADQVRGLLQTHTR